MGGTDTEGVRDVIGRRLNRLSQRCNETLTIASIIGREFEMRQLSPLVKDISRGTGCWMCWRRRCRRER